MKIKRFKVGDKICFKPYGDEEVETIADKQVGNNMLFMHTDCLKKEYSMYGKHSENGYTNYEESDLCKYLNKEILANLLHEIREKNGCFGNDDYLRLPIAKESFGVNIYSREKTLEVIQFECIKKRNYVSSSTPIRIPIRHIDSFYDNNIVGSDIAGSRGTHTTFALRNS